MVECRNDDERLEKFLTSIEKIALSGRMDAFRNVLTNFLDNEVIDEIFKIDERITSEKTFGHYIFITEKYFLIKDTFSSGQNILLYIITEIVANIRYDSLILYDEPETHLHPNYLSRLINVIFELVEKFESYCIIATHSPLVIQEIPSRDVYVVERQENSITIRNISSESFGENLTTLTEDIFGARDVSKKYIEFIKQSVEKGISYEDIVSMIETDGCPLSLNVKLLIKSFIFNKNAESNTV